MSESIQQFNSTSHPRRRRAFTLVELIVVIGIIALLVSILIPTVSAIRRAASGVTTSSYLTNLAAAAEAYRTEFGAYPGVLGDRQVGQVGSTGALNAIDSGIPVRHAGGDNLGSVHNQVGQGTTLEGVTSTENLYLSLMGGLVLDGTEVIYDPTRAGEGPLTLKPGGVAKSFDPFYEASDDETSRHTVGSVDVAFGAAASGDQGRVTGRFVDNAGAAADSIVPEFVDRYNKPMPVLYLRPVSSRAGAPVAANPRASEGDSLNPGTYQLSHILGYTGNLGTLANPSYIGEARNPLYIPHDRPAIATNHGLQVAEDNDTTNGFSLAQVGTGNATVDGDSVETFEGPYDAIPYLIDPSTGTGPRQANSFILISAGPDRIYGTKDDITNFGPVVVNAN